MKLTKILSGVLTAAMVGTMLCSTAFAAERQTENTQERFIFSMEMVREPRACVIPSLHMKRM